MARLLCSICGAQEVMWRTIAFCNDVIFSATLVLFQFPRHTRSTFYLPAFTSGSCVCLCGIRADGRGIRFTVRTFNSNEIKANDNFDEKNNNFDREEVTINRLLAICERILFFYHKNCLELKLHCTAQRIRYEQHKPEEKERKMQPKTKPP